MTAQTLVDKWQTLHISGRVCIAARTHECQLLHPTPKFYREVMKSTKIAAKKILYEFTAKYLRFLAVKFFIANFCRNFSDFKRSNPDLGRAPKEGTNIGLEKVWSEVNLFTQSLESDEREIIWVLECLFKSSALSTNRPACYFSPWWRLVISEKMTETWTNCFFIGRISLHFWAKILVEHEMKFDWKM